MIHERCHVASFHQCDICGKRFRSKEKMKCHRSEIFFNNSNIFYAIKYFQRDVPECFDAAKTQRNSRSHHRVCSSLDIQIYSRYCVDIFQDIQIHSGDFLCQMKLQRDKSARLCKFYPLQTFESSKQNNLNFSQAKCNLNIIIIIYSLLSRILCSL